MRKLTVIYEDEWLLALDKPAGIIVDKSSTIKNKMTVEDWLGTRQSNKLERNGIVHRLDKETSGILLAAKTTEALKKLQALFKERKIEKTYLALVHGQVRPNSGEINLPIARSPFNRKRFGVFPGGRTAQTSYKVIDNYRQSSTGEEFSLLEVKPKTGRTHQIRVHLKHIGYSIVSDGLYAGRKTANKDRRWCSRLFLQAEKIKFIHPITNQPLALELKLARSLRRVLNNMKKD